MKKKKKKERRNQRKNSYSIRRAIIIPEKIPERSKHLDEFAQEL